MENYDIFLSYRKDEGEALACLISERLRQREFKVYYDVESPRAGRFRQENYDVIENCKDVICILAEHGLDRCDHPDDWMRREISCALRNGKNIIPVTMRGFAFPEQLPEDIANLPDYPGISVNMEYFSASFEKLLERLHSTENAEPDEIRRYTSKSGLISKVNALLEEVRLHNTPSALYRLADCCYTEVKNPALYEDVFRFCRRAAEAGLPEAQNLLGRLYEEGHGTEKNIAKAFEWYYKGAAQGLAEAEYNLAQCFQFDYRELSAYWMEQAAAKNHENAMCEMGDFYDTGYGVKRDSDKADYYYRKLAQKGNLKAKNRMTASQKICRYVRYLLTAE